MGLDKRAVGGGWGALVLALLVGTGPAVAQGFREDEFECEETVAYLKDCCDGLDAKAITCDYYEGCTYTDYPVLSPAESRCIRDRSCKQIRDEGICERVLSKLPKTCDDPESCTGGDEELCK